MKFTYNGVAFALMRTAEFLRQPVYSGDGADWLCNRYLLDVWGHLNPQAMSYAAGPAASPGILAPQTDNAIRHALNEPRRAMVLADDAGNVLFQSPPPGNTRDAIDGPKVVSCSVRPVGGSKTWLIHWVGETFLQDCAGPGTDPVLSNRWANSSAIGDDQRTTVTTRGEARFRMDALEDLGQVADAFRSRCVPPCPAGYRRRHLSVVVGSVGDRLSYEAVDEQQYFHLGDSTTSQHPDVLDFRSTYAQQTIRMNGSLAPCGQVAEQFRISVMGKPQAAKARLLLFAVRMAINRVGAPVGPPVPALEPIITGAEATEEGHAPLVTFRLDTQRPADGGARQGMAALRSGSFFVDGVAYQFANPEMDAAGLAPDLGADNNTRTPSALALAFASALQSACSPVSPVKGPPGAGSPSPAYQAAASFDVSVSSGPDPSALPSSSSRWSQSNAAGPYNEYRIDNRVDVDEGLRVAPTSGPVNGVPDSSGKQKGHSDPKTGGWTPVDPTAPTVEIMRVALPTATLTADWTAERLGSPPTLPDPTPSDPNYRLLWRTVQPANVGLAGDGQTPAFRVSGQYHYAMLAPPQPGDPIPFPVSPDTDVAFAEFAADDLAPGLVMAGGSAAAAGGAAGGLVGGLIGDNF